MTLNADPLVLPLTVIVTVFPAWLIFEKMTSGLSCVTGPIVCVSCSCGSLTVTVASGVFTVPTAMTWFGIPFEHQNSIGVC